MLIHLYHSHVIYGFFRTQAGRRKIAQAFNGGLDGVYRWERTFPAIEEIDRKPELRGRVHVECWRQIRTGEKGLLPQDAPLGAPRAWGCTLSADPASRWRNHPWSYRNSVFWVIKIAGQGPCLIWLQIMRCKLKWCRNACHWIHKDILSRECLLPRHLPFSSVWKPNTKQTKRNWNSDESIDGLVNR